MLKPGPSNKLVVLLATLFWFAPPAWGQSSDAASAFAKGSAALNAKRYDEAELAFKQYLWDEPRGELAAEARYKLATTYLLRGRMPEAQEQYQKIVEEAFDSPWSGIVLFSHFEEKPLQDLANARRQQALHTNKAEDFTRALKVYHIYYGRFVQPFLNNLQFAAQRPALAQKGFEVLFKAGDCGLRGGETALGRQLLEQVQKEDTQGSYGKLATFRLGGEATFKERLEELSSLALAEKEPFYLFLDLADKYGQSFQGETQAALLHHRGRCLAELKRQDEATASFSQVLKDHGTSRWADESAFYLAELSFQQGKILEARNAYRTLMERFPDSVRTIAARDWITWLDQSESTITTVQAILEPLLPALSRTDGSLTLLLKQADGDGKPRREYRVAVGRENQFLFQLKSASDQVLFANTDNGFVRQIGAQGLVQRVAKPISLRPRVFFAFDSDGNCTMNYNVFFGDQAKGTWPLLSTSPETPAELARLLAKRLHVGIVACPDDPKQKRLLLQWPQKKGRNLVKCEIDYDSAYRICSARCRYHDENGKSHEWTMTQLRVGEGIPSNAFDYALPEGVTVKELSDFNLMETLSQCMQILALITATPGEGEMQ